MWNKHTAEPVNTDRRITILALFFLLLALWVIGRLFLLQIIQNDYYSLFALNSHEIVEKLQPQRGEIFFKNSRGTGEYPAAVNKVFYQVYAVPRELENVDVTSTAARIATIVDVNEQDQIDLLRNKLLFKDDSYEPLVRKVDDAKMEQIKALGIKGIYFSPQNFHYYPEEGLAGNVLGFAGFDEKGSLIGRYGLEGYWEKELAGKGGFMVGERGALGSWIALVDRTAKPAEDGADLVLSIDRAIEYKACERLREGAIEYKAKSAALILMESKTGRVIAMCSYPDFDPNNYSKVDDVRAYNNTAVYSAYEPGSVFKPIAMAAGVDLGLVGPNTTFVDPCEMKVDDYTIHNAEEKCYGLQTMTQVLENSINTGMVWLQEKIGNSRFSDYVNKFGFGEKTGIGLASESSGDISSLSRKGRIFGANGSYGQGLTVTPIQIAAAFSALTNGGQVPKPIIAEEIRYESGKKEKTSFQSVGQAISARTARIIQAMLVSVVENHYKAARIVGYYVGGKTGTAQVPEKGKYSEDRTIHTFAGFAPGTDPRYVLVVKYEEPERKWAEQTALPIFRDVMEFVLKYYDVPKDK